MAAAGHGPGGHGAALPARAAGEPATAAAGCGDGAAGRRAGVDAGGAGGDVGTLVSGSAASAEGRNSTLGAVAAGLPGAATAALEEVPFSSRWKWSGIRREDGWLVLGAPDVLLAGRLPAEVSGHEQEGRRVLAFGRAEQVVSPADGGGGTPRIEPLALGVLEERPRDDAADT